MAPDGWFCGAIDTTAAISISQRQYRASAKPAPSPCIMCERCTARPPTCPIRSFQYRAADAWPLLGFAAGIEKFDELLLVGDPTLAPRLAPVPVRLPLPPAEYQGSIYENQRAAARRFFETAAERECLMAAE
jgi:hypothetical protein